MDSPRSPKWLLNLGSKKGEEKIPPQSPSNDKPLLNEDEIYLRTGRKDVDGALKYKNERILASLTDSALVWNRVSKIADVEEQKKGSLTF